MLFAWLKRNVTPLQPKALIIDIGDESRTTNSQQPATQLENTESDCHYSHVAEEKVFTPGKREEKSKEEVGG